MIFIIKIGIQLNLNAKIKHENKYEHNKEYVMNEKKKEYRELMRFYWQN